MFHRFHPITTKLYEGYRHEIHNYNDIKDEVEADMDKYIYCMALSLEQPFTTTELLKSIHVDHIGWKIELIEARCKKFKNQKMLKKTGYFHNAKYECLLSIEDLKNAIYIYSKSIDRLSWFVCGL